MLCQTDSKTFESFSLEGLDDIKILQPGIRYYTELIRNNNFFAFVKRTHGFWDLLVEIRKLETKHYEESSRSVWLKRLFDRLMRADAVRRKKALDESLNKLEVEDVVKHLWESTFINDLLHDLQNPHQSNYYFEAISFRGFSNSGGTPEKTDSRYPIKKLREAVLAYCPNQPKWHDALVWKDAVFSGELKDFFDLLKRTRVIIVGPSHLKTLGGILGYENFHHISIRPPTEGIKYREQTLDSIMELLHKTTDTSTACIFQAGALAYWLIYRLFSKIPNTFFLDVGRVLDIWYPDIVSKQHWFVKNRELIITKMELEKFYR